MFPRRLLIFYLSNTGSCPDPTESNYFQFEETLILKRDSKIDDNKWRAFKRVTHFPEF